MEQVRNVKTAETGREPNSIMRKGHNTSEGLIRLCGRVGSDSNVYWGPFRRTEALNLTTGGLDNFVLR